jgi:hypothetical protein
LPIAADFQKRGGHVLGGRGQGEGQAVADQRRVQVPGAPRVVIVATFGQGLPGADKTAPTPTDDTKPTARRGLGGSPPSAPVAPPESQPQFVGDYDSLINSILIGLVMSFAGGCIMPIVVVGRR